MTPKERAAIALRGGPKNQFACPDCGQITETDERSDYEDWCGSCQKLTEKILLRLGYKSNSMNKHVATKFVWADDLDLLPWGEGENAPKDVIQDAGFDPADQSYLETARLTHAWQGHKPGSWVICGSTNEGHPFVIVDLSITDRHLWEKKWNEEDSICLGCGTTKISRSEHAKQSEGYFYSCVNTCLLPRNLSGIHSYDDQDMATGGPCSDHQTHDPVMGGYNDVNKALREFTLPFLWSCDPYKDQWPINLEECIDLLRDFSCRFEPYTFAKTEPTNDDLANTLLRGIVHLKKVWRSMIPVS